MGSPSRLAVFDLDGTITRRDSFLPYVFGFLVRHPLRVLRMVIALPAAIGYLLGLCGRGALKSALIRASLGGVTRAQLTRWNLHYVPRLLADGLFPDALQAIARHRAAGDMLVLMSASPDLYVPEVARRLGFAQVICTEVRWQEECVDGQLVTLNRRGNEKTRCLEALRASHPGLPVTAYGNSDSDLPHMSCAESAVLVNGDRKARRNRTQFSGIRTVEWR
ncbi:MAG: HAD-IB family hydrolase [Steroidobacteraceae bacterium]